MKKAAFLDRDGTINEDIGPLFSEDRIIFIPGALEALKMLGRDHLLFIITNQPWIELGFFSLQQCSDFSARYEKRLKDEGITIEKTFFCPHLKGSRCACIKPGTHFIEIISGEYPLDLRASVTIGDHPHDVEMGRRAGTKTAYLLTGHGRRHIGELAAEKPDITAENLLEAAREIVRL